MKTISLGKFKQHYYEVLKPKGVRMGQALSTTFIVPHNNRCEITEEQCDDQALAKFITVAQQAQWVLASLTVVDSSHLDIT